MGAQIDEPHVKHEYGTYPEGHELIKCCRNWDESNYQSGYHAKSRCRRHTRVSHVERTWNGVFRVSREQDEAICRVTTWTTITILNAVSPLTSILNDIVRNIITMMKDTVSGIRKHRMCTGI